MGAGEGGVRLICWARSTTMLVAAWICAAVSDYDFAASITGLGYQMWGAGPATSPLRSGRRYDGLRPFIWEGRLQGRARLASSRRSRAQDGEEAGEFAERQGG